MVRCLIWFKSAFLLDTTNQWHNRNIFQRGQRLLSFFWFFPVVILVFFLVEFSNLADTQIKPFSGFLKVTSKKKQNKTKQNKTKQNKTKKKKIKFRKKEKGPQSFFFFCAFLTFRIFLLPFSIFTFFLASFSRLVSKNFPLECLWEALCPPPACYATATNQLHATALLHMYKFGFEVMSGQPIDCY